MTAHNCQSIGQVVPHR